MIEASGKSFLLGMTARLAAGLAGIDPERARRHISFFLSFQQTDGGFAGREGGSDLYYTSFAVRGLALLNALDRPRCNALATYLKSVAGRQHYNLIDLVSWFYSAMTVQIAGGLDSLNFDEKTLNELCAGLETFRRADGGYAKTDQGGSSSTYHSFLAVVCYEMIGLTPPNPDAIVEFLRTRRRADGGFVEIGAMKRSGTNPTAAAAILLKRFDAVDDEALSGVATYIANAKGVEGGLRANTQIPFCDLLSTFTGLLVAQDLGLVGIIDSDACGKFVGQLELSEGGFRGASWDSQADPEYTFYGLGVLALLGSNRGSA